MEKRYFIQWLLHTLGCEVKKYETGFSGGGTKIDYLDQDGQNQVVFVYADYSKRTNKVSLKFKGKGLSNLSEAQLNLLNNTFKLMGKEAKAENYVSSRSGYWDFDLGRRENPYLRIVFKDGYPWG